MGIFDSWFRSKTGNQPKKRASGPRVNIEKRFTLHGRLGQGSMSAVWRATDSKSGRQVCVKVLDKKKLELLLKRFVGLDRPDEGEIAAALSHPSIVRTIEHGVTSKGEQFLVMEFLDGVGLNFLIDTKSKQLIGHELELLLQAAEGLAYIHAQGYIHRDVCPRNMMVLSDGTLKIIDFGLTVPNKPAFRKPGNRTGTANYMAPELIRRSPTDERIDVFSFGVTVYETLTGGFPWESTESLQTILQHLNWPARDPRELKPDLDQKAADVLLKGVERDPGSRFRSMGEFIAALRGLREAVVPSPG